MAVNSYILKLLVLPKSATFLFVAIFSVTLCNAENISFAALNMPPGFGVAPLNMPPGFNPCALNMPPGFNPAALNMPPGFGGGK